MSQAIESNSMLVMAKRKAFSSLQFVLSLTED